MDHPSAMNCKARWLSSGRLAGASPILPKLSTVRTSPAPKRWCHIRFTITRAVRGFRGLVIQSASSSRPLALPLMETWSGAGMMGRKARLTAGPLFLGSPRRQIRQSATFPSATPMAKSGAGGALLRNWATSFFSFSIRVRSSDIRLSLASVFLPFPEALPFGLLFCFFRF